MTFTRLYGLIGITPEALELLVEGAVIGVQQGRLRDGGTGATAPRAAPR